MRALALALLLLPGVAAAQSMEVTNPPAVGTVTAGDGSITIGGTATAPTIACTAAGASQAGCVTTGTQTLAGAKTWTGAQTIQNTVNWASSNGTTHHHLQYPTSSSAELDLTDSSNAVLHRWDTSGNEETLGFHYFGTGNPLANGGPRIGGASGVLTLAGAVAASGNSVIINQQNTTITSGYVLQLQNNGVVFAGFSGGTAARPTCDSSHPGLQYTRTGNAGAADTIQVCLKGSNDAYTWNTLVTATGT